MNMGIIIALIKKLGGGGSVPKPLTYDYMPEGYPQKSVQTETPMEEQEVAFAVFHDVYMAAESPVKFACDYDNYKVIWDGVVYECKPIISPMSGAAIGNNHIFNSSFENTGEPFLYLFDEGMWLANNKAETHTIGVTTVKETVTPMAEEFMPDKTPVFYFDSGSATTKTLYDENETAVTIEQLRAAGINAILCHKGSDGQNEYFRPVFFYSNGTNIAYYTMAAGKEEWYTAGFSGST